MRRCGACSARRACAACLGLPALVPTAAVAAAGRADTAPGGGRPPGLPAALRPQRGGARRAGAGGGLREHPVRLLIVGDSIALTLGMGLSVRSQAEYGVAVSDDAALGCDLDPGLEVFAAGTPGSATQGCSLWRALWPFLTAGQRPQVVALGLGRWEVTDHLLHGQWVHIGEPVWDEHLTADLRSAIAIFQRFGARVVLFTMPYVDPSDRQLNGLPWSENKPARVRAYNVLVRQVAPSDPGEVSVIDLNRMLSPGGAYTASLDGVRVRSPDGIHISPAGAQLCSARSCPWSTASAWRTRRRQGPGVTDPEAAEAPPRPRSSSSPCRRPCRWHPTPVAEDAPANSTGERAKAGAENLTVMIGGHFPRAVRRSLAQLQADPRNDGKKLNDLFARGVERPVRQIQRAADCHDRPQLACNPSRLYLYSPQGIQNYRCFLERHKV